MIRWNVAIYLLVAVASVLLTLLCVGAGAVMVYLKAIGL